MFLASRKSPMCSSSRFGQAVPYSKRLLQDIDSATRVSKAGHGNDPTASTAGIFQDARPKETESNLGDHFKTGHTLSLQNRPTEVAEDVIVLPCRSVCLQGADWVLEVVVYEGFCLRAMVVVAPAGVAPCGVIQGR